MGFVPAQNHSAGETSGVIRGFTLRMRKLRCREVKLLQVPQLVGDIARACVSTGPAFQYARGHHQNCPSELPDSSGRSADQGAHPISPDVEKGMSRARRPDFLVLLGL